MNKLIDKQVKTTDWKMPNHSSEMAIFTMNHCPRNG